MWTYKRVSRQLSSPHKSDTYKRSQQLAADLLEVIDHPRITGLIRYHEDGDHKVCVEIYAKQQLLSQGSVIFSVVSEPGKVEVWTRKLSEDAHALLESFAQESDSELLL